MRRAEKQPSSRRPPEQLTASSSLLPPSEKKVVVMNNKLFWKKRKRLTDPREFATFDKIEVLREKHRIPESGFLSGGKINILRTGGIERETALRLIAKGKGTLGVMSLH